MKKQGTVAVVAGGRSAEAEVSEASAQGVCRALIEAGYEAPRLSLDETLCDQLSSCAPDVVFPVAHGPMGEDGKLQGLLEILDYPYVGSDVLASAVAAHKPTAKGLFRLAGLPLAREVVVTRQADLEDSVQRVRDELGGPVVVKPASGGSAIGVTLLEEVGDFAAALKQALLNALAIDECALVESLQRGAELTCGVLDEEGGTRAFPPTLIEARAAGWYDFRSKYQLGGSLHTCPAPLSPTQSSRLQELAIQAHLAVGARDLSRTDFIVGEETIVLEVNTLPGMTQTSLYPEAAAVAGIPFPELCHRLVQRALSRPLRETPTAPPIPKAPPGE